MSKPSVIYICGPRSGLPDKNNALFFATELNLQGHGHAVINPVRVNRNFLGVDYSPSHQGRDRRPTYPGLRADVIALLSACDAICLLPNWDQSIGCRAEVALGITFNYLFVNTSGDVIERPDFVVISCGYSYRNEPIPAGLPSDPMEADYHD